jgi:hypothetical protein
VRNRVPGRDGAAPGGAKHMSDTEFNLNDFLIPEPVIETCRACGDQFLPREGDKSMFCRRCRRKYPDSLLKALPDNPFEYAIKLRTGEVWFFTGAEIQGDYVHLEFEDPQFGQGRRLWETPRDIPFCRGVDVRISDIVWCADAPDGS